MTLKDDFEIKSIPPDQTHEWLLKKHYAKRVPAIIHSFGLYDSALVLQGVCTYGTPARMLNDGYGIFGGQYKVTVYELNRLVINEGLPKNVLSFFVSQTFRMLPIPVCLVSYADSNAGHHGYIYQATNWIFTGKTSIECTYFNRRTNEIMHPRTVVSTFGTREADKLPDFIEVGKESGGKYRYVQFLGNKQEVKKMKSSMVYKIENYPKGNNLRYDADYKPSVQGVMF